MTYIKDLDIYTYTRKMDPKYRAVGWLDVSMPFDTGDVPGGFLERIKALAQYPLLQDLYRGWHTCNLASSCNDTQHVMDRDYHGNGSIYVFGHDGLIYVAPEMLHHYVRVHRYCPPQVFIDAVMTPVTIDHAITP